MIMKKLITKKVLLLLQPSLRALLSAALRRRVWYNVIFLFQCIETPL